MICGKYRSPFSFDKHISFIIKTATKTSCLPNALRKVPRTKNIIKSAFASSCFMRLFQTLLLHQRSMCSKGLNKDETEYVHAYGVKLIFHASVRKSSIVLLNFGEV